MDREFLDALTGDPSAVDDYFTHTTTKPTASAPTPVARTTTTAPTGGLPQITRNANQQGQKRGCLMTPEERTAQIEFTKEVQVVARRVLHDPGVSADIRQAARDIAVVAHTDLTQLEGGHQG